MWWMCWAGLGWPGFVFICFGRGILWEGAARSVPLQRLGTMQEFGWLVALLAGPLGRALSGSVVTLDGGLDDFPGPWPPPGLAGDDGDVPTEDRRPAPS